MKIAVLKEKRDIDGRVILLPDAVKQLVGQGHTVLVEKDAGKRIYISNEEYKEAGAKIVKNPFSADIIVKIRAPLPNEFRKLRKGPILMSFLHINSFPQYAEIIRRKKCKAIAWELIKDKDGKRLVGVSRISGELGMLEAFRYAKKIPEECKVLVLGPGEMGSGAIQTAMRLGANVQILGR
ncbi:MAG: hypothetical protein Q8N60_05480, partial [Candidatus Diapherotrites archaeon]|nr:hypothetical protein [Candidatus Diapherotrites archaeon]